MNYFKIIFVASFFCLLFLCGKSQSLAFSRVILLQSNVSDTVPAGKTWKLESWTFDQELTGGSWSAPITISLNGVTHYLRASARDGNSVTYDNASQGPLWFPAGTAVRALSGGGIGALSILEFTIMP